MDESLQKIIFYLLIAGFPLVTKLLAARKKRKRNSSINSKRQPEPISKEAYEEEEPAVETFDVDQAVEDSEPAVEEMESFRAMDKEKLSELLADQGSNRNIEERIKHLFHRLHHPSKSVEMENSASPELSVVEIAERLRGQQHPLMQETSLANAMPGDLYERPTELSADGGVSQESSAHSVEAGEQREGIAGDFRFSLRDAIRYQVILGPRGGWRNPLGGATYRG